MMLFGLGKYIKEDENRLTILMQKHETIKPNILCKKQLLWYNKNTWNKTCTTYKNQLKYSMENKKDSRTQEQANA